MMKKSKFIFSLLLLILTVSFVYSFDFGFTQNSSLQVVKVVEKPLSLSGNESVNVWAKVPMAKWATLMMDGNYALSFGANSLSNQLDLGNFYVEMDFQTSKTAKIGVDLGRIQFSDFSGLIYNNSIDGGKIDFELSDIQLKLFSGYTGLLNGKSVRFVNILQENDSSKVYQFAPGMLISGFSTNVKNIFSNSAIGCNFSTYVVSSNREDVDTTVYAEVGIEGPLSSVLYHKVSAAMNYSAGETKLAGVLATGDLMYYPSFLSSSVTANVTFATDTFYPITDTSMVFGEANSLTGLLKFSLNGSLKPISTMVVSAGADFAMDVIGSNVTKNCIQWNSSVNYQILSDLALNLFVAQKIALTEESSNLFMGSASLVLNF